MSLLKFCYDYISEKNLVKLNVTQSPVFKIKKQLLHAPQWIKRVTLVEGCSDSV